MVGPKLLYEHLFDFDDVTFRRGASRNVAPRK